MLLSIYHLGILITPNLLGPFSTDLPAGLASNLLGSFWTDLRADLSPADIALLGTFVVLQLLVDLRQPFIKLLAHFDEPSPSLYVLGHPLTQHLGGRSRSPLGQSNYG